MELREPVALGKDLQDPVCILKEAGIALDLCVSRRIACEDKEWQRLVLLPDNGNDSLTRTLESNTTNIYTSREFREGSQQTFDLVTMWADEAHTGVLWIFKTRSDQKQRILGHGVSPARSVFDFTVQ